MQMLTRETLQEKLACDNFRFWLQTKKYEGRAKVGTKNQGRSCPIANYVRETFQATPAVGQTSITAGSIVISTPEWAVKFIQRVDNMPDSSITPSEALYILGDVWKQGNC